MAEQRFALEKAGGGDDYMGEVTMRNVAIARQLVGVPMRLEDTSWLINRCGLWVFCHLSHEYKKSDTMPSMSAGAVAPVSSHPCHRSFVEAPEPALLPAPPVDVSTVRPYDPKSAQRH